MWAALTIPVLWLAAILAYAYEDGMNIFVLMGRFSQVIEYPFAIGWKPHTPKFMLISLICYAMGIGLYYTSRENRRPGEEYGSAKWGSPKQLCQKYMDHKNPDGNVILTQNVMIGMDGHKHRRNLNILVVGGSGSGKTRFFCKPGIMSANCSYLITDPKGEMLRATGQLLKDEGYDVKVFNLIDPSQSDGYNPFRYLRDEKDALKLIDNLIKNTTPRNASSNDPFWEKAEIALDSALMLYLMSEAPPEEQNFETMMLMIKALYEKEWEGMVGNCDTLLFLGGGNEPTSLEFMVKLLGKETLDTRTRGLTKGQHGSSSTNYQQAGRELMMMDEIRMLDTNDAILLIRGEPPVLDKKYDILKHKNLKRTEDGGAPPYVHRPQADYSLPDLPYQFRSLDDYDFIEMEDTQHDPEKQESA